MKIVSCVLSVGKKRQLREDMLTVSHINRRKLFIKHGKDTVMGRSLSLASADPNES